MASHILSYTKSSSSDELGTSTVWRTHWEQDRQIIDSVVNANSLFGRIEIKERSEGSLSDGGNSLTVVPIPAGVARKQVCHR